VAETQTFYSPISCYLFLFFFFGRFVFHVGHSCPHGRLGVCQLHRLLDLHLQQKVRAQNMLLAIYSSIYALYELYVCSISSDFIPRVQKQ
jgi:hypothetical protein